MQCWLHCDTYCILQCCLRWEADHTLQCNSIWFVHSGLPAPCALVPHPEIVCAGGRSISSNHATASGSDAKVYTRWVVEPGGPREPGGLDEPGGLEEPGGLREPGGLEEPGGLAEPGGLREPGGLEEPGGLKEPGGLEFVWSAVFCQIMPCARG